MISIVIPVKDGGDDLRRLLDAIDRQAIEDDVEVVVIDSGSTDGSVGLAEARGARVEVIPADAFNHGASRNHGAELARGEMLVFISQDALPADERWLAGLIEPLRSNNGDLAGVYGRQVAHELANPSERFFLDFLYGPQPRLQRAAGRDDLTMETTLFSNVNAAMPRAVWERFRFAEDIIMSEDQEWTLRVLLAGQAVRYEPAAVVRHSHPYTIAAAFRRFFDSGVSAERAYHAGKRPAERVLRRAAADYARRELAWLWQTRQRRWIPYAVVYELAKFAGLQLGARHRRLPRWLARRCSAMPGYWSNAAAG